LPKLVPYNTTLYCHACGFPESSVPELVAVRNLSGGASVRVCRDCANRVAMAASDLVGLLDSLVLEILGPSADVEPLAEAARLALLRLKGEEP
jgi:hypothetical protein